MTSGAGRYLSGGVARRLFMLFVLSAFVPLAALALLSYFQSRDMLLQQGQQRLAATAKSYGMALFERLLLLSDLAASTASNSTAPAEGGLARQAFTSLARRDNDGQVNSIIGVMPLAFGESARARLDQGKAALTVEGSAGHIDIMLAVPLQGGRGTAIATLAADYLWQPEMLPAATDFCVLEEGSTAKLFCSADIPDDVLRIGTAPAMQSAMRAASWTRDGAVQRSVAWPQFMGPMFGTLDWVVVASQPEAFLLARLLEFQRIYIPVVALALLLVGWLTVRQSRSIVGPVAQLAARARGIAAKDFSGRVDMDRSDEFGELATAFNLMSSHLGRQFATLTALSEIDQLILASLDTPQVVRSVLQRMGDLVPADFVGILLLDAQGSRKSQSYSRDMAANDGVRYAHSEVSPADLELLEAHPGGSWFALDGSAPAMLRAAGEQGIDAAYLQPILWRSSVCGMLVLGYRGQRTASDEDRQLAREFADRVAVAVSSAWRDEQLYQQAHFDALTGLPNRLLFKDRLGQEVARCQREDRRLAVLFIDIDRFKAVNDTLGHSAGDIVLREAARRIAACVRESDTVSRLGGDEFTVLLGNIQGPQDAARIADQIQVAISTAFDVESQRTFLGASIGIVSYPGDGATPDELLKNADTAMYRAKAGGRAMVVYFEEKMNADAMARLTLDHDLREAIERGELTVHYQPLLDLRSGKIRGAEALLRWHHPVRGWIPPVHFIPVAEETGFIEHLGRFALENACTQMSAWKAEGLPVRRVSVNVSPRQLRNAGILETIAYLARQAGIGLDCLEVEITESLLIGHAGSVEGLLKEMQGAGLSIALDDFGTGFSSMAYLNRFPIHTIKIDRVFVDGLGRSRDSEAIVEAIIAMSHALGKSVVAEGVETLEQLEFLRNLDCNLVQGYYIARPMPATEFREFVRNHGAGARAAREAEV